ncbi:RDD family protein [Sporosarcina limicola]|uniref:RDD family membrane protein YckC n=1 Tax=Sporosarcina limicola TaxID=34101 RepID=A0A927MJP5_9BACL|nr:RDD family protein [Sporosarcina limicola]MBE1554392.1 putative RDD family membrane protein YckC [Sporosarcina limicola]
MSEHIEQQQSLSEKPLVSERNQDYETVQIEHFRAKNAGFWTRLWAYMIDLLVVGAISGILIKPIFRVVDIEISNPYFLLFSPYKVTLLILFLLYFTLMTRFFQQTVGKMVMGIKVVPKNGGKLTWSTVIFREVIGRFISKMLVIPYLLIIFMPKKEAMHDLFADTVVEHEHAYEKEVQVRYLKPTDGQQLQEGTVI